MKVLNLEPLTGGSLSVDKLQEALNYYVFERDILTHCRDKKLSRVVQIVDSFEQQVTVSGTSLSLPAYCLVFEMANGDSRSLFDVSIRSDAAILCVLHNVAVGLDQLHRNGMTHQDVKPANVLTFSSGKHDAKLADLGRAVWLGRAIPHDAVACPGDVRYAPFEQIYGDSPSNWLSRQAADLFMLGSLVCFLFTGSSPTRKIMEKLPDHLKPPLWNGSWSGVYASVLPIISNEFSQYLLFVDSKLPSWCRTDLLKLIEQMCHPDISQRGDPKALRFGGALGMQAFISKLGHISTRARLMVP